MVVRVAVDADGPYFALDSNAKVKVRPDFRQRHKIGLGSDLLARAIGFKKGQSLKVLDLTAGLCRDTYHFVCLGCEVVALERKKELYEVVQHYVRQLPAKQTLQLKLAEANDYLQLLDEASAPDVIYFDPIFPEKKKSAKVGKESELLQLLGAKDSSSEEAGILTLAKECARRRVVVKRPVYAPTLTLEKPGAQYMGKAVRYDVYFRIKK